MKDKWLQQEVLQKSIIVSTIYSLLMILIGAILIVVNTSYICGALIGVGLLYFSYLIIWILWYKIPSIKTYMAKMTAVLSPSIRIVVFLTTMFIIVFFINSGEGTDLFLYPINIIMMLLTYTLVTMLSFGTIVIIDSILESKEITKQEEKEVDQ